MNIRPITNADYDEWLALWELYNQFYKRTVSHEVTLNTWKRILDPVVPVFALVAAHGTQIVGFTHYLFHYHTALIEHSCYLQDLFTLETERGKGVGRQLIEAVSEKAKESGSPYIYWHTHETNEKARILYDKVGKNTGFIFYKK